MKNLTLCLIIILTTFISESKAQFGLRAQYVQPSLIVDESLQETASPFGVELAAFYWLRLDEYRVEFLPEISFAYFSGDNLPSNSNVSRVGISIPTRLYFLDFKSDCDCPTFSKQNDLFKNGFFLQLAPGYFISKMDSKTASNEDNKWSNYFGASVGVGLDIGISDLITITPMVNYGFFPNLSNSSTYPDFENELKVGFTAIFRPDY